MENHLKFFTSISNKILKKTLFRGVFLSFLGMALLLAAAIVFPPAELKTSGFFLFLVSMALLAIELIPYRRLQKEQENPDFLLLEEETLSFYKNGKLLILIPLASIKKLSYCSNESLYGLCFSLDPEKEKAKVMSKRLDPLYLSKKKEGIDLFLPYFSEQTFESIKDLFAECHEDE